MIFSDIKFFLLFFQLATFFRYKIFYADRLKKCAYIPNILHDLAKCIFQIKRFVLKIWC